MRKLSKLAPVLLAALLLLAACGPDPTATPPSIPPTPTAHPPTATPQALNNPTPTQAIANVSGLFDVGGHQLFIDCQGTGSPTVILDAGLGVDSGTWARVQPQLTGVARVCRYDRAGLGRSARGPMPRTSQQMVQELHTLLAVVGLTPPYILAGASFGGLNVQLYAIQYPQEVAGLILVDSLHPDFDVRIEKLFTPEQVAERRAELSDNLEGLTFDDILASQTQVREAGQLPDLPMVVLRHGRPFEFSPGWPAQEVEALWVELQTDLANRSSTGQLILAERAGHRIHEMRPDLVIQAIKDMVAQAQSR